MGSSSQEPSHLSNEIAFYSGGQLTEGGRSYIDSRLLQFFEEYISRKSGLCFRTAWLRGLVFSTMRSSVVLEGYP